MLKAVIFIYIFAKFLGAYKLVDCNWKVAKH